MTSTTETFVHLQHMYHEKAQVDLALMKQYVADVVTLVFQDDADFTSTTPTTIITSEEMECFCKKVQYLQVRCSCEVDHLGTCLLKLESR